MCYEVVIHVKPEDESPKNKQFCSSSHPLKGTLLKVYKNVEVIVYIYKFRLFVYVMYNCMSYAFEGFALNLCISNIKFYVAQSSLAWSNLSDT